MKSVQNPLALVYFLYRLFYGGSLRKCWTRMGGTRVPLRGLLVYSKNMCTFPPQALIATRGCVCAVPHVQRWHPSCAFVYIFVNLFVPAPVLKRICLLCVTRLKRPPRGLFVFVPRESKRRVWLTRSSSVFDVKGSPVSSPGVRHWSERPGQNVCVYFA